MKKLMVIVVLALLLVSLVSVANASGPVYQPVSQDSEPPKTEEPTEAPTEAPTESPTEAPGNLESEDNNDKDEETEAPKGACERAYHYIENTLYNKDAGYSILRSNPWCRVWIFLKYGKAYSIPDVE